MRSKTTILSLFFVLYAAHFFAQKYYPALNNTECVYTYNSTQQTFEEVEEAKIISAERSKGLTGKESYWYRVKPKSAVRFKQSKMLCFVIQLKKDVDPSKDFKLLNIIPNLKTNNREVIVGGSNATLIGTIVNGSKITKQFEFPFTSEKIGVVGMEDQKEGDKYVLRWLLVENLPPGEYYWNLGRKADVYFFFGVDDAVTENSVTVPELKEYVRPFKLSADSVISPIEEKYSNGNLKEKGTKKGKLKTGEWLFYQENGSLKKAEMYNGAGQVISSKYYRTNGKIESEATFVNGKRDGLAKEYGSDGQVESSSMFKNGEKNGLRTDYYKFTDKVERETNYVNGVADGPIKSYYQKTGKLFYEGTYFNDKKEGKWTYYRDDGKTVMKIENYKEGKLDGERIDIYGPGRVEKSMYKEGEKIK